MTLYRYYCADTDSGKHFCLMAKDDMEAAYRADTMAKEWYNTTLKDVYLDKHANPNRRYNTNDIKEIFSQQLR